MQNTSVVEIKCIGRSDGVGCRITASFNQSKPEFNKFYKQVLLIKEDFRINYEGELIKKGK